MCIFCQIVSGVISTTIRWQDAAWIAIDDIHPKARTHVLLVSKRHIESLASARGDDDQALLQSALPTATEVARQLGIVEAGYKVVINTGAGAGQVVDHLHLHLLSGEI